LIKNNLEISGKISQIQELTTKFAATLSPESPEGTAQQRRLKQVRKLEETYAAVRMERRKNMTEHHELVARIRVEIGATEATESRLEATIQADRVKLEPSSKRLLEVL
jgi:hypothetical protein